jgi:hypothetical protein
VAKALKSVEELAKSLKLPAVSVKPLQPKPDIAVTQTKTSGFVQIIMYIMAGILLICIILLGVDQWITPIFQRSPGGSGYIPIPGTDASQVVWLNLENVANVYIGKQPAQAPTIGLISSPPSPQMTVIEGQEVYSMTMDVFIQNEYSQKLPLGYDQRILFVMGMSVDNPILRVGLDNTKNTIYVTVFDNNGNQQSVVIDNVPIRTPFRVGVVVKPYAMEGYMNGRLVMTKKLNKQSLSPATGSVIFSPSNIIGIDTNSANATPVVLSKDIKVLNVRGFGYAVPPTEMYGRMIDLKKVAEFKPVAITISR